MDPEEYDWQDEDDGRERGNEPPRWPGLKVCEGQNVPHAHKDDAREYRYLNWEGEGSDKSNLCSRCVAFDRARGFTLERTFEDE